MDPGIAVFCDSFFGSNWYVDSGRRGHMVYGLAAIY